MTFKITKTLKLKSDEDCIKEETKTNLNLLYIKAKILNEILANGTE
jgi:hypothetical protein